MNTFLQNRLMGKFLLYIFLVSTAIFTFQTSSSALELGGLYPLTPGASTDVNLVGKGDLILTTVLCLGSGELTVELTKDDTQRELVIMFIVGSPADPAFLPGFGVTPTTISLSTTVDIPAGGFGTVYIFSIIDFRNSREYKLSLEFE